VGSGAVPSVSHGNAGASPATAAVAAISTSTPTGIQGPMPEAQVSSMLTEEGTVLGTVGYIAPEHLLVGVEDARSDQFAFCVTMYVMLYGRHPFPHRDLASYMDALERPAAAPPPSRVPGWIHAVIARGLRGQPSERFATMADLLAALERDPSRRRRAWALGLAAAAACATAIGVRVHHRAELQARCGAGEAVMASTWSAATQGRVREGIRRAGGAYGPELAERVERRLSDYAREWVAGHRQASEAALLRGDQSLSAMETRLACLDAGRAELEALAAALAEADAAVAEHAIEAAYRLPAPARCVTGDVSTMTALPASPELRQRMQSIERSVAQASALTNAGADARALAFIDGALADVRAIRDRRTEARLLLLQAKCYQGTGAVAAAATALQPAFEAALAAGDYATAGRAAASAAFVTGAQLVKDADASRWLALADAIAEGLPQDEGLEMNVLHSRVMLPALTGLSPEKMLELQDREIALAVRVYGEQDPYVARITVNKGIKLQGVGRWSEAIDTMRLGIAKYEAIAGADNPHLDVGYGNLGMTLTHEGRFDEAAAALAHAIALQGPNPAPSAIRGFLLSERAILELRADRPEAAVETATVGLQEGETLGEQAAFSLPKLLWARGKARARAQRDFAGEAQDCARLLAIQEARGDATSQRTYAPDALECLAEAELEQHQSAAALAYLERDATLVKRDPQELAWARFALARALRIAGRDPERALSLAREAREGLRGAPGRREEVAAVDAWLADAGR
jgi:hypothetical protein